ncbi:hypothetical protein [Staphylococcus capitis]|uniref:hypothetical protein n=1 Tax=Staphylococcus capitis TaxID=29388 RepID=UPI00145A6EDD|nr:hypothetical protein [Staphylococcus capitis]MEB5628439.1 hypothetical protein [Staphylococcus capitis]NMK90608.1 hypothetical protein [Staphylococcus capitis]NMK92053.1 hypothetical protein [Staphylococcus capitis]
MTIREYLYQANDLLNKNKTGNLDKDNFDDSAGKYQLKQIVKLLENGYNLDDEYIIKEA